MDVQPFDLQRMFIGDYTPLFMLEIVFRTAFMYIYAIVAARLIGKRGMGQLTPFEYIVVIALGSATGDPMFYPEVPLLHGIVTISIIILIEKFLTKISQNNKKVEEIIESKPLLVVSQGKINFIALKKNNLSKDELLMMLRMNKVRNVGYIEKAYLEPSGKLSIFESKKAYVKDGTSTFPQHEL